jgi:hypothetical protein
MVPKISNIINGLQQQIGLLYLKNVWNQHMYRKLTKIISKNMMKDQWHIQQQNFIRVNLTISNRKENALLVCISSMLPIASNWKIHLSKNNSCFMLCSKLMRSNWTSWSFIFINVQLILDFLLKLFPGLNFLKAEEEN